MINIEILTYSIAIEEVTMPNKIQHGANLFEIQDKYGFSIDEIMDFSSNVNPFGPDKKSLDYLVQHIDRAKVYPDPAYKDLKSVISQYIHCPSENIVLGAGTTNLLSAYISLIQPKNALLNSPCYSEYERELKKHQSTIHHYLLDKETDFTFDVDAIIEEIQAKDIDLYVLTNPNNPTGSIMQVEDIEKILLSTKAYLLIDETYIEFTDQTPYTACQLASQYDHLFVVRSTSKFFASPGIRLGYGILSHQDHLLALNQHLNLWGINIYAEMMGRQMFGHKDYQDRVYQHIKRERARMITELKSLDSLKVYPSQGNFVLCELTKDLDAKTLREKLLPEKIVIRDCASFPNLSPQFFRFCILSTEANNLLLKALKDCLS